MRRVIRRPLLTIGLATEIKLKVKEPTVLAMDRLRFQPGGSTPWHYHPGAAFVIVTAGAVTEHTDDGCMNVDSGRLGIFRRGRPGAQGEQ